MTHRCVIKLTITCSDSLSPVRRQAIIWTIAGVLFIVALGIKFSEILIESKLKVSSAKYRPFCLGLNELRWSLLLFHPAVPYIPASPISGSVRRQFAQQYDEKLQVEPIEEKGRLIMMTFWLSALYIKGQQSGSLMFPLMLAWTNYWTNRRVVGDSGR